MAVEDTRGGCTWCAFEHGTPRVIDVTQQTVSDTTAQHCFHCLWNLFRNTPHYALRTSTFLHISNKIWDNIAENMRQLLWRKFAENMTTGQHREGRLQKNFWTASVAEFYDQFLAVIWINIWWCFGQWGGNEKAETEWTQQERSASSAI